MKTVSEGGSYIRKDDGKLERVAHTAPAPGRDEIPADDKGAGDASLSKRGSKVKTTRKAGSNG